MQPWANRPGHPFTARLSAPPALGRMERFLLGLLVVVALLLVVMPVLLYLVGWGIARFVRTAPVRGGFPVPRPRLAGKAEVEIPAQAD